MESQNYHRQILAGDVMDRLKKIPDGTFDCIITSPPYWALRDYSMEGQWGLEKTPQEYLEKMKLFMEQLKRVLKGTGSCWINLGDTYASGGGKGVEQTLGNNHKNHTKEQDYSPKAQYRKTMAKSRMGITEQFYLDCIKSGWIARNVIPWIKWNAMPQSVKDRFTNKWEYVYFFAKEQKYYFNLDAVRIATQDDGRSYHIHKPDDENTAKQQTLWCVGEDDYSDNNSAITEKYDKDYNVERLHRNRDGNPNDKQDNILGDDGKPKATYKGFNDRWKNRKYKEQTISKINSNNCNIKTDNSLNHPKGKNPGDLTFENYTDGEILEWIKLCRDNLSAWELAPPDLFCINPKPMPEQHFASFPVALPKRILKCACPKQVCIKCGYPKIPISKPTEQYQKVLDSVVRWKRGGLEKGLSHYKKDLGSLTAQYEIVGYDTCDCSDEFIPGIVLDPFFGAGSTGIAAELEGVRWCGIELKEEYSNIARKRLSTYVKQEALVV